MNNAITLDEISIRTGLQPGDTGDIMAMHGRLYYKEYGYTRLFEYYVAQSLAEFLDKYEPGRNRIWVCEHHNRMVGSLVLMDRGDTAQLRYFLLEQEFRGFGLGSKLLDLFMEFLRGCGYRSSYLWTTGQQVTAAKLYMRYGYRLTKEKPSVAFGVELIEQRYDMNL